jgi:hypothetical protein
MKILSNTRLLTQYLIAFSILSFAVSAQAFRQQSSGAPFYADGSWYNYYESNGDNNSYLDTWSGGFTLKHTNSGGDVIGAKGWKIGSYGRKVNFDVSSLTTGGTFYAAVYGWFKDYPEHLNNGIVEYYVVENHRNWKPEDQKETKKIGREYVGGSWYTYYTSKRYGEDHAFGNGKANFTQYWAIRETKRLKGQVDMGAHFYNWSRNGAPLKNQWGYQMFAVESYYGTGTAIAKVW